jgi:transposase
MSTYEQSVEVNEVEERAPETVSSFEEIWECMPDYLSLPGWRTIALCKTEHDYNVIAEVLTLPECPCGLSSETLKPAGTLVKKLWDEPKDNRRVQIHFLRKRFKCPCGKNLLQPLAGVAKGRSVTARGAKYIALESLGRSFEEVAHKVGVSSKTVKEIFADFICEVEATRKVTASEVLGIDGVCVGRRKYKRSYCLLTDISNSRVLELLSKSTGLELAMFLKQLAHQKVVKIVVIDMAAGFLSVVRKCLPGVIIVIDPYHVLCKLNDAVNNVVRKRLEGLSLTERKQLMTGGNRFLLLKRRFELTEKENEQLETWFEKVPEFKLAYNTKETGYDIWKYASSKSDADERFTDWRENIPEEVKPAFQGFLNMVKRWGQYIFNFFDFRVTNAFTESKNREIKSLQRHGRRTSFIVLRARLLYAELMRKPARIQVEINARRIREAMKKAKEKK